MILLLNSPSPIVARLTTICHSTEVIIAFILVLVAGILATGSLFEHRRLTTFLASGLGLSWSFWLLLTLLARSISGGETSEAVFMVGAILLLIPWLYHWRDIRVPGVHSKVRLFDELVPIVMTGLVLVGAVPVLMNNGWQGDEFVMHGFYNGDTTTFGALTQRSLLTQGLVQENVFSGNGPLEYPTLLHASVAELMRAVGLTDLLPSLSLLTVVTIIVTVPTLWLLWDSVVPPVVAGKRWQGLANNALPKILQFALPAYVLALSWDAYIYPQSHFFLSAPFVLLAALLLTNERAVGRRHYVALCTGLVIALVLLLSNAVTGTVAMVAIIAQSLVHATSSKRTVPARATHMLAALFIIIVFFVATPGEGAISYVPGVSYTAAGEMLQLALPLLLVVAGLMLVPERSQVLSASVGLVTLLALVTYFFSARDIVVENASRFFYHAIVIGFPMTVHPLARLLVWFQRALHNSSQPLGGKIGIYAMALGSILLLALPPLASGASAYDNLLFQNETVVMTNEIAAHRWLAGNTSPTDIVAVHPDGPWNVPLFTGRSVLRTNYWLDADDDVTALLNSAFAGDADAQAAISAEAQYLLLSGAQLEVWNRSSDDSVFTNDEFSIFAL